MEHTLQLHKLSFCYIYQNSLSPIVKMLIVKMQIVESDLMIFARLELEVLLVDSQNSLLTWGKVRFNCST